MTFDTDDDLTTVRELIESLRSNSRHGADVCATAADTIQRMTDALRTLANMQKPTDPDPTWNSGFEAALVDVSKLARYGLFGDNLDGLDNAPDEPTGTLKL